MAARVSTPETICVQCSNSGFTNAFVYCVKCLNVAVHRYCLDVVPNTVDEFVHWVCNFCDDCPSNPNLATPSISSASSSSTSDMENMEEIQQLTMAPKVASTKKVNSFMTQVHPRIYTEEEFEVLCSKVVKGVVLAKNQFEKDPKNEGMIEKLRTTGIYNYLLVKPLFFYRALVAEFWAHSSVVQYNDANFTEAILSKVQGEEIEITIEKLAKWFNLPTTGVRVMAYLAGEEKAEWNHILKWANDVLKNQLPTDWRKFDYPLRKLKVKDEFISLFDFTNKMINSDTGSQAEFSKVKFKVPMAIDDAEPANWAEYIFEQFKVNVKKASELSSKGAKNEKKGIPVPQATGYGLKISCILEELINPTPSIGKPLDPHDYFPQLPKDKSAAPSKSAALKRKQPAKSAADESEAEPTPKKQRVRQPRKSYALSADKATSARRQLIDEVEAEEDQEKQPIPAREGPAESVRVTDGKVTQPSGERILAKEVGRVAWEIHPFADMVREISDPTIVIPFVGKPCMSAHIQRIRRMCAPLRPREGHEGLIELGNKAVEFTNTVTDNRLDNLIPNYVSVPPPIRDELERFFRWNHFRHVAPFDTHAILLGRLGFSFWKGEEHWAMELMHLHSPEQVSDRDVLEWIMERTRQFNQEQTDSEKEKNRVEEEEAARLQADEVARLEADRIAAAKAERVAQAEAEAELKMKVDEEAAKAKAAVTHMPPPSFSQGHQSPLRVSPVRSVRPESADQFEDEEGEEVSQQQLVVSEPATDLPVVVSTVHRLGDMLSLLDTRCRILSEEVKKGKEKRKVEEAMLRADVQRMASETARQLAESARLQNVEDQKLLELRMRRQVEEAEERARAELKKKLEESEEKTRAEFQAALSQLKGLGQRKKRKTESTSGSQHPPPPPSPGGDQGSSAQ